LCFKAFKKEVSDELTGNIIPFWTRLRDNENGGFYGNVSFDLEVEKDAPKGSVYISRILWFFSECYLALGKEELLDSAKHVYDFLTGCMIDEKYGGVYWTVDSSGQPLDTTKHVYAQAFAIYALSAFYKASKNPNAISLAKRLYELIETKCSDSQGYGEAYDREWNPVINEKLSENGITADKTMNTLLHVFEAYSGLIESLNTHPECSGEAEGSRIELSLRRILSVFKEKVFNPELKRFEVFFDDKMSSLIDLQSYGHDIEASWLIDWGTELLGDIELSREIGEMTSALAESVMERAFKGNGYVWNERENDKEDKKSVWWVQAEAVLGFLNHYDKHPEKKEYEKAARDIWEHIKHSLIDRRDGGEWFEQLDKFGRPDPEKPTAGIWKCPYHNGRMCLRLYQKELLII